jgi:hypothetical protein
LRAPAGVASSCAPSSAIRPPSVERHAVTAFECLEIDLPTIFYVNGFRVRFGGEEEQGYCDDSSGHNYVFAAEGKSASAAKL